MKKAPETRLTDVTALQEMVLVLRVHILTTFEQQFYEHLFNVQRP